MLRFSRKAGTMTEQDGLEEEDAAGCLRAFADSMSSDIDIERRCYWCFVCVLDGEKKDVDTRFHATSGTFPKFRASSGVGLCTG